MKVIGLYSGKLTYIGEKRNATGIYKQAVSQVSVDKFGIKNDIQADKRFHGGPEKALHQYALSSYEKMIKRFPLLHKKALPGSIGENISAIAMNEHNVCIGDIYQIGSALVQVSSPRIPCWKIDVKFKQPNLNQFISQHGLNGWYYRVLEDGEIKLGDTFALQKRPNTAVTISTILKVITGQADEKTNELASDAVGLDPEWKTRLQNKYPLSL